MQTRDRYRSAYGDPYRGRIRVYRPGVGVGASTILHPSSPPRRRLDKVDRLHLRYLKETGNWAMYAKIFASLYQGTLRGHADEILVFVNMIATSDKGGIVDKHPRAIAEEVGISEERVRAAALNLEAPDPESRNPDEKGARIVRVDEHRSWGWRIVSHEKYRQIRSAEDRREQNREAQERARIRNKESQRPSAESAHAESEAESESESESDTKDSLVRESLRSQQNKPPPQPELSLSEPQGDLIALAVEHWNEMAGQNGVPLAHRISPKRRKKLGKTLADIGGLEVWKRALANVAASDFLCGRKAGSDFLVSIDWLFTEENITKILEGNYGKRTTGKIQPVRPPSKQARQIAALERGMVERRERERLEREADMAQAGYSAEPEGTGSGGEDD